MNLLHHASLSDVLLMFSNLVPKDYVRGDHTAEFDYSKPIEPTLVQYSNEMLPAFNDTDNLVILAKT